MKVYKNHSLKELNAFHIDVKAKYLVRVTNEDDFKEILSNSFYKQVIKYVLGESSGTLFTKDFDGLVIKVDIKGIKKIDENDDSVTIDIGAGEIWDDLVVWAIKHHYEGIENMSGIPGTVGAAPVQNIGAYGQDFAEIFLNLHAINLNTGELKVFNKSELKFEYRDSVFKNELKDKYIITKVLIQLNKQQLTDISYHSRYESLTDELAKVAKKPYTLSDIRSAILSIRSRKFPNWKIHGNSGSYFKNPIVEKNKLKEIQKNTRMFSTIRLKKCYIQRGMPKC
jgi:UDP-N-acetylmuramate dehydrogenase